MSRLKILHLNKETDLPYVDAMRRESKRLREIQQIFRRLVSGRRCIVVGSAPDFVPPQRRPDDCHICVNGSAYNAERSGVSIPDVSVITSHTFGLSSRVTRRTFEILHGRHTAHLFLQVGTVSEEIARERMNEAHYTFGELTTLSAYERAAIIGEVCGIELGFGNLTERTSTGVSAAIFALWGGAQQVVICGFSLHGGHGYSDFTSRRYHIAPDITFFELCAKRQLPVVTTSDSLSRRCGVTLTA